jgi:hypothetical protein
VSFTPVIDNYGGTQLIDGNSGTHTMKTRRIDSLFDGNEIFFMKVDVENSEEWVLKGMNKLLERQKVHHFVMEVRSNQAPLTRWFYSMGYSCGLYNKKLWTEKEAYSAVEKTTLGDIYCTVKRPLKGLRRASYAI